MIELKNDSLVFSFPEVHKDAKLTISFQRTLTQLCEFHSINGAIC